MPLDFRHDSAGLLPALRLIAEAGIVAAHLMRRSIDRALEQVPDLALHCLVPERLRGVADNASPPTDFVISSN
jgi:hypothetical protein